MLRFPARLRCAPVLSALLLIPSTLLAVTPVLWTTESYDDFEKGKPEGVAVSAAGEVSLAPGLKALKVPPLEESAEPFLWSETIDSKGTVFVGGGNGGRVYRIPRDAAGSIYYETGDLAVHALVVDRSDVLYAATSPQGKVYRITGEAKGEVYYQPEDRYIWDLAVGPKGELYAATGEHGSIYRITGKGKAELVFRSDEAHIVSLRVDPSGALYAGSDGKGLIYKISPQGKVSVLFDAPLREISALAIDPKGVLYAAGIGIEGEPAAPAPPSPPPLPPNRVQTSAGGAPVPPAVTIPGVDGGSSITVTASASGPVTGAQEGSAKSEVYRIDPDGGAEVFWSSPSEAIYALAIDPSGRPVIGSGEPGRIRVLTGPRESTLLAKLAESQVTALLPAGGKSMVLATSNVGRVYALDSAAGDTGTYLSAVHDARATSRWGRIAWRASLASGSKVEISTRSGNSGTPDATWSDWSSTYATPDGSAVATAPARFLQWRARLSRASGGAGPVLSGVSVGYVQTNLPPRIKRLTIAPPGVVRERLPYAVEIDPQDLAFMGIRSSPDADAAITASAPTKRVYVRGMRAIDWEAEDPNGDALSYDVLFRGAGESSWKPLARDLRDTYFAFDSTQLPDGLYRLRVEASDAPSNPGGQAKSDGQVSDPILIDNSPPTVQVTIRKGTKPQTATIDASANDGQGPIARAEYSLDAARFIPLAPVDGVSDSRSESYSLTLEGLRPGEHTIIIKVTDLLGNVGAGKAIYTSE